MSVWGSRILEVRGRKSGQPRRVPVNLLRLDGAEYLVSARGVGGMGAGTYAPLMASSICWSGGVASIGMPSS